MIKKPKRGARGLNVYSNLSAKRRGKKDVKSRKKAEYLASLPKHPVKRLLYRMHPKRFFAYWFSKEGLFMALKITGVAILFLVLFTGALFAYFRQELDQIRPEELAKRVQTTVTRYYDRNDILLWEDRGENDYRLAVESDDLSQYLKDATVAIEDRDFYNHSGVSIQGISRALVNNFSGGDVQGGSTLTQQLVKQVFIEEEEAQLRGLSGVPRKIKESILAIEVERMYNKDQILTLYLNESPYGGRRNGAESAAQTYFGKSAKDLNLSEAALLAGIPQQPGIYDPYNSAGHEALIARQHHTLNNMAEFGFVTKQEAEDAKKVAILDTVLPESEQYKNIKAPHFVQMVRADLENELGKATVGRGGLTVKTTLDWRVQEVTQNAISHLFNETSLPETANFNNGAATVVDSQTGQVLAMQGSRDYTYPGYGQDNASTAFIQPGSSIKPLVFAELFKQRPGGQANYGAGSMLSDENINSLVGYELNNYDNRFRGNMSIRSGLAESRNIPAVKAFLISGRSATLQTIHDMGDKSYCTQGVDQDAGPALAIGGCGLKQVEHTNAFATFARMGEYKETASVLEVKNNDGDVLKQWKDEGKQVLDPQIAYIMSDILSDDSARAPSFGPGASGLNVPGVKTATKTGTSNIGDDSKDLWMMSYSPKASLSMWVGNNDTSPMNNALSGLVGPTVDEIMGPIHRDIFQADGTWSPDDWFERPEGVQNVNVNGRNDLFPSWYSQQSNQGEAMVFDRVSKKKATDCTPEAARIEINVQKFKDPVTNRENIIAPDGYNGSAEDDLHKCDDVKPFVSSINATRIGSTNRYRISVNVNKGTHDIDTVEATIDGTTVQLSGNYSFEHTFTNSGRQTISVKVTDTALYDGSASETVNVASSSGGSGSGSGSGNSRGNRSNDDD